MRQRGLECGWQVRLWTESILQAASLINTFLENGEVAA